MGETIRYPSEERRVRRNLLSALKWTSISLVPLQTFGFPQTTEEEEKN